MSWDGPKSAALSSVPLPLYPQPFMSSHLSDGTPPLSLCFMFAGEIPNLFPSEDIEGLTDAVKQIARDNGRDLNRDSLFSFFVERCRIFLHIVLCMSPIGAALRTRLRKFPALVNCCTIDWFSAWPAQALQSVAKYFLDDVQMEVRSWGHRQSTVS